MASVMITGCRRDQAASDLGCCRPATNTGSPGVARWAFGSRCGDRGSGCVSHPWSNLIDVYGLNAIRQQRGGDRGARFIGTSHRGEWIMCDGYLGICASLRGLCHVSRMRTPQRLTRPPTGRGSLRPLSTMRHRLIQHFATSILGRHRANPSRSLGMRTTPTGSSRATNMPSQRNSRALSLTSES